MCGVFGFVANRNDPKGPDMKLLANIARVTMTRGAHAFGFSWIDERGTLRMFKQAGRIVDHMGLLGMVRGARMLIGHCRFATMGHHWNNLNNHPHPVNGGWLVHNGVVTDYREVVRSFGLRPTTGCDSEVFGLLAERHDGPNCDRLLEAVLSTEETKTVVMGLWNHPRRLTAIRRGNPLHWGTQGGSVYLASLPDNLPGRVALVPDRSLVDFTNKGIRHEQF